MRHACITALALALFAGASAHAAVITFDGLVPPVPGTSHRENGFVLTSTNGHFIAGGNFGSVTSGPVIFPDLVSTIFTLQTEDGRPFNVSSIELGPLNGSVGAQTVTFTGHTSGGGTVSADFTTTSTYELTSYKMGPILHVAIAALTWTPGLTITDNITVTAVPEPTTLAALALSATALLYRRRA